jgi:molybdopterin-guanine dinucleotide biosynthesis protein A
VATLVDATPLVFAPQEPPPFLNLNTPEDLAMLPRWLAAYDRA